MRSRLKQIAQLVQTNQAIYGMNTNNPMYNMIASALTKDKVADAYATVSIILNTWGKSLK